MVLYSVVVFSGSVGMPSGSAAGYNHGSRYNICMLALHPDCFFIENRLQRSVLWCYIQFLELHQGGFSMDQGGFSRGQRQQNNIVHHAYGNHFPTKKLPQN
ncbi:hypothetical protein M758_1G041900 [Ceratodon purpureus]|uniref:Uncharacterized protein n=1 Tax=Ceratodon purpureus TaxID=3225 RepID=A0A8T0J1C3_CERPU|nr:hypothetical protein KC19_1G044300 [Ceratodon purpureus]KAG0628638.1 hypothetical protein M758_1G041900 [Ceratodon purpureus]